MRPRRSEDAQIFFCTVLVLAAAFVGAAPAKLLVRAGASVAAGPALIARIGPQPGLEQTLGVFHAFFIVLPAAVGFLAVGLPVLIGYLAHAIRWGARVGELVLLLALSVAITCVVVLPHTPTSFVSAIAAVLLLSAAGCWPLLRRHGTATGLRVLAFGGLMLLGLAYFEYRLVASGVNSRAVAPTLLVVASVCLAAGLPAVSIGEAGRGLGRMAVVGLLWLTAALWACLPLLRGTAASANAADWLEVRTTALLAIVLTAAELVHQRRRQVGDARRHR